ncbi:hypothetical protein TWF506_003018 [Arthrobotrys conoides]|uniref:Uncharacterized protein n=1 Tax=Arthrobotrys conoides TaxID=74498 RepID=A0AAN8RRB5_9PEZI
MVAVNPYAILIPLSDNIKFAIANSTELYSTEKKGLAGATVSRSLSQRIKDGKDALWLLGGKSEPKSNLATVGGLLHRALFGSALAEETFSVEVEILTRNIKKLEIEKSKEVRDKSS